VLRLDYRPGVPNRNVRLGLQSFVMNVLHIPERTLDLLELAAYIYAADRHTKRGDRDAVEFHSWSRRFRFRMKVRDLNFWKRADVQDALRSCLTFMTGDADFSFVFTGGHKTPPTSLFDQEGTFLPPSGDHQIALFSGGLDSLSGAVQALASSSSSLVLVSHQSQPSSKQVQRGLARTLNDRFSGRAKLYAFECSLSGTRAVEETQRSRSFLYTSIGFALAQAFGRSSLTVYENGVTSLNLRRREDLANARASRTTHPRALAAAQSVLRLVGGRPFEIETPAFWMTKTDVIHQLVAADQGDLIASSVSCSRMFQREGAAQCGRCFQCVDRRLAIFAAGKEDLDSSYAVDIMRQTIPDPESKTTIVDYLRQAAHLANSTADSFQAEYVSELADALDSLPALGTELDRVQRVWELMQRHGQSVRHALQRIHERFDDPLKPLPTDSLPSLVSTREHLRPAVHRLCDAISNLTRGAVGLMFKHEGPTNENDLNAKLGALIGSHHELTSEHPAVPFACGWVKPDHSIPAEPLLWVESKFIRDGTPPSKASEGMAGDLTKYPSECHILFLVYDPHRSISNDEEFIRDFEKKGRNKVTILR
jgi:7-cyano-7-deazaguanine synthase in queuosine biosynthesis